jgi:hypothetical protein
MKVDQRRSQTLIQKNKNKNTIKKQQKTTLAEAREAKHTGRRVVDKMELFCANGQMKS